MSPNQIRIHREKYEAKLKEVQAKLYKLQATCKHPNAKMEYITDMPTDYGNFKCPDCGLQEYKNFKDI